MLCIVSARWSGTDSALRAAWPAVDTLLADLGRVHFASVALLPPRPGQSSNPSLLFELVIDDGLPPAELVDLLVSQGLEDLWPLYGGYFSGSPHTTGAAERRRWLRRFLLRHLDRAAGGFVGNRDRTVAQVRQESDLFRAARQYCARLSPSVRADRSRLARELVHWAADAPGFAWAAAPAPRSFWRGRSAGQTLRRRIALALLFVVIVLLAFALGLLPLLYVVALLVIPWILVVRRGLDRPLAAETPRAQQVHPAVDACEAGLVGRVGHMISLTEVRRPYALNAAILRIHLRLIGWLGHVWFTEGRLGDAAGIKFGHWHLVEGGRRLLFCSNFDGSFGGYLDEFIGGASIGVNLVWRWTELRPRGAADQGQPPVAHPRRFPPTRLGAFGGCKNELWFKTYARDSMLPHLHRFEAYCESNEDIARATALREALFARRTPVADDRIMRALES
jgi:hypothetical protein